MTKPWQETRAEIEVKIVQLVSHPGLDREARMALFDFGARLRRVRSANGLARLSFSDVLLAQADRLQIARSSLATKAAVARLLGKAPRP